MSGNSIMTTRPSDLWDARAIALLRRTGTVRAAKELTEERRELLKAADWIEAARLSHGKAAETHELFSSATTKWPSTIRPAASGSSRR